jgi:TRAP-type C4-dicarboxylate transport system permease small subunit
VTTIKRGILRIYRSIILAESIFCFIGLSVTILLITAQVFNRYWLHFEIMWFSDLALYIYLMYMFVAATLATSRESHVSVDSFRDNITKKGERATAIYKLGLLILSIVIASFFIPVSYQLMAKALQYPEYGTLVPWFNTSWIRLVLTISYSLVILHLIIIARRDIRNLITLYRLKTRR